MSQAYGDSVKLIDAIETWLSSDPVMNWMNLELDNFSIVSNSDAHSLENFCVRQMFLSICEMILINMYLIIKILRNH